MSTSCRQAALAITILLVGLSVTGCRHEMGGSALTPSSPPAKTAPLAATPSGAAQIATPTPEQQAAGHERTETWQPAGDGIPAQVSVAAMALAPSDHQVLYLAAYEPGGIYRSSDGGSSWAPAGQGLGGLAPVAVAVHPTEPDIVWVGTVTGGFHTTNGGLSWQTLPGLPRAPVYALAADGRGRALYVGGEGIGIWYSLDGGLTWTAGKWPQPETGVLSLSVAPDGVAYAGTAGQGVWASRDLGQTWHEAGRQLAVAHVGVLAAMADGRLYALADSQLYLSRDQGNNWEPVGPPSFEVLSFAVEPGSGGRLYLGSRGRGLAISLDEGQTWSLLGDELWHADITCVIADPTASGHAYLGTRYNGLYQTHDGGQNWSLVTASVGQPMVAALASSPNEPRTLYAGTLDGAYRSRDRGEHWQCVSSALGKIFVQALAVAPSGGHILAGTSTGLYVSRDGAETWARAAWSQDAAAASAATETDAAIFAIVFDPQDETRVYAGSWGHNVLRSLDGGETWAPVHSGLETLSVHAFAIDPADSNKLYAGTVEAVYRSTDGGRSWLPSPVAERPLSILALVINPEDPTVLYAGTSEGVYRSTDGGRTWQAAGHHSLDATVTALAFDPGAMGTLYAGTEHHGAFRTADGGEHWQSWGLEGTSVYAILANVDGSVWLGTERGIFRNR